LAPTAVATTSKKVKGKQTVRVTWSAASDVNPATGIGAYKVYRDGILVGSTSGLTFDNKCASVDGAYTFTVTSVDGASHESPQSDGAAYPPPGGGGGSTGGNSGKGGGKGGGSKK
jgi:hypothetical protein